MSWADVVFINAGRRIAPLWPRLFIWLAKRYPFRATRDVPLTPLRKPLRACRVALITTAGLHLDDQPPFDMKNPLGDWSFREFPRATPRGRFRLSDVQYDRRGIERDLNVVFPLQRLEELAAEGIIAEVSPRHFGFMGYILKTDALVRSTARDVAARLRHDGVDAAVITPA
ncbi:MAG: glycine/sarcosine/betaine reductase selenoprotein B family protein [Terriglobia bacterium]